jgi:hypothetical protein
VQEFNAVNLVFAGILLFSSFKLLQGDDEEDEDLSDNYIVKTCSKLINSTGDVCSCRGLSTRDICNNFLFLAGTNMCDVWSLRFMQLRTGGFARVSHLRARFSCKAIQDLLPDMKNDAVTGHIAALLLCPNLHLQLFLAACKQADQRSVFHQGRFPHKLTTGLIVQITMTGITSSQWSMA